MRNGDYIVSKLVGTIFFLLMKMGVEFNKKKKQKKFDLM